MIKLYSPQNEVELSFIKSILDGESIPYFVHNDHFGSLKVGPQIELFNAKTIMVDQNHFDRAKDLLDDFLKNIAPTPDKAKPRYSVFDKIRMIIEVVLFSWIMPGKKRSLKKYED
jgi:hypothetical protein